MRYIENTVTPYTTSLYTDYLTNNLDNWRVPMPHIVENPTLDPTPIPTLPPKPKPLYPDFLNVTLPSVDVLVSSDPICIYANGLQLDIVERKVFESFASRNKVDLIVSQVDYYYVQATSNFRKLRPNFPTYYIIFGALTSNPSLRSEKHGSHFEVAEAMDTIGNERYTMMLPVTQREWSIYLEYYYGAELARVYMSPIKLIKPNACITDEWQRVSAFLYLVARSLEREIRFDVSLAEAKSSIAIKNRMEETASLRIKQDHIERVNKAKSIIILKETELMDQYRTLEELTSTSYTPVVINFEKMINVIENHPQAERCYIDISFDGYNQLNPMLNIITKPQLAKFAHCNLPIGKFKVSFELNNGRVKISRVYSPFGSTTSPIMLTSHESSHPHVNRDGQQCWGGFGRAITSALATYQYDMAFIMIAEWIPTYSESRYWNWNELLLKVGMSILETDFVTYQEPIVSTTNNDEEEVEVDA
jgi:hypothetical protein